MKVSQLAQTLGHYVSEQDRKELVREIEKLEKRLDGALEIIKINDTDEESWKTLEQVERVLRGDSECFSVHMIVQLSVRWKILVHHVNYL